MQFAEPLDSLPLWGLYVATVVIILLAVEGGHRLGKYRRQHSDQELEAPVGVMVGATLGLLACIHAGVHIRVGRITFRYEKGLCRG